jgi:hypothetical protein
MPLGLAGLVCCVLMLGLVFRLGQRSLQQERVRMRADVTAYSGGIELARCLNILSLSEKMRVACQDAVYTVEVAELISKFQKIFILAAPWLVEADTVFIGYRNEVMAVPVWNQSDMAGLSAVKGIVPALRISSSGGSGSSSKSGGSGQDKGAGTDSEPEGFGSLGGLLGSLTDGKLGGAANEDGGGDSSAYHYQSGDGTIHDLDQNQAGAVQEHNANGGTVTRFKDDTSHKYVSKSKAGSSNGLSDEGGHFLGIWVVQPPGAGNPGWVLACSQVRIAGGDVNSDDSEHGASYRPFFVPVRGGQNGQGDAGGGDDGNSQGSTDDGGNPAILGLAAGLGMDLGPVRALFTAASQAMEIQH